MNQPTENSATEPGSASHSQGQNRYLMLLTLGALGVVYGDIGTSPLYALRECFHYSHDIPPTPDNVLGVLSLILWTLIAIVSVKYLLFVLRADNKGEGGNLALMALLLPYLRFESPAVRRLAIYSSLFGASLIYGDGVITPAISVLSAVEGLSFVTPMFEDFIVPITVTILVVLFLVQKRGTGSIGSIFGPIILLWFTTLALLGIKGILLYPAVFKSISPHYGIEFVVSHGKSMFLVLGSVFLVATGTEALYADMGHFGRKPIRLGWFAVAFPALVLNYLGQGALLITQGSSVSNPFFQLAPSWGVLPLVILATAATVIASQALISGAFSLTRQAVQLGYLPRLEIAHTSSKEIGQIYIPAVNFMLLFFTLFLVFSFRSSSGLAAAYGLAVSCAMLITSVSLILIASRAWRWSKKVIIPFAAVMLLIDLAFFSSNAMKLLAGGWVPLVMAAVVFTIMTTWYRGREILAERLRANAVDVTHFVKNLKRDASIRVPGVSVFMSRDIDRVPNALLHNVRHNKVVHKTVILLRVITVEIPLVNEEHRIELDTVEDGFYSVTLRYGFMETPDVPAQVLKLREKGLAFDPNEVTYFLGRETILPSDHPGMEMWRENMFAFMTRIASRANKFYQVPAEQVIEIGSQVEI